MICVRILGVVIHMHGFLLNDLLIWMFWNRLMLLYLCLRVRDITWKFLTSSMNGGQLGVLGVFVLITMMMFVLLDESWLLRIQTRLIKMLR
jgi:hypothetical protein